MAKKEIKRRTMANDAMTVNHIQKGLTTSHLKLPPAKPAASEESKPVLPSEGTPAKEKIVAEDTTSKQLH